MDALAPYPVWSFPQASSSTALWSGPYCAHCNSSTEPSRTRLDPPTSSLSSPSTAHGRRAVRSRAARTWCNLETRDHTRASTATCSGSPEQRSLVSRKAPQPSRWDRSSWRGRNQRVWEQLCLSRPSSLYSQVLGLDAQCRNCASTGARSRART